MVVLDAYEKILNWKDIYEFYKLFIDLFSSI